uniref:Hillarin-like n=1 Tax=Crassostrea virginica TaxID=6565 RepID=A0A8B8DXZ0_CRAVI|nr:hillarin-like [Crassostrea virginica]XP_022333113.1 hillarin-like [Crassostrea virginica]
MGCGGSKSTETSPGVGKTEEDEEEEDYLREPESDPLELEDIVLGYPPPKPSKSRKDHIFTEQDKTAADSRAQQIKLEDYESIQDLARALTDGLINDVQKVRAIFTWIGLQGSKGGNSKKQPQQQEDPLSPQVIMQQVTQRKISYNFLFTSLCRAAGIPCVVIRGLGKSVSYEVGDQDVDDLNNSWTAVYVSGGWRFVFPLWAFSGVVGHSTGTWTLVENQGKGTRQKEEESSGVTISHINDYYFLTDPEEFVYICYPHDSKWQLLARPFTKQDFIEIAYCRQRYFLNHHRITTPNKCLYKSHNGVCDVGIKKLGKEDCIYTYKLYFNHKQSKTSISSEVQLERYVAVLNEGTSVRFRVRFPSEGIYKLQILDDDWRLCEFKLECDEDVSNVNPFPCNPESGFGPTTATEEAGLQPTSHRTGVISIKKTKNVNIRFNVTKNVLIETVLVHNNMEQTTLNKHVHHKVRGQELDINVDIPQEGEYALQINTKDKDTEGPYKNACNYLLTSENMNKRKRKYENAFEKKIRKDLQLETHYGKLDALKKALENFDKLDLEDKGDRQRAIERITYLSLRKELKDAIARRHGEKLEEAIDNAKNSEYKATLQKLITEAEELLSQLRRLRRFAHEVLHMQQTTISEIHNYKHPKPLAYDIMKATYILLGEEERQVEEWEQILALMRRGGKQGLLRRVRQFDTVHVTENMVNHASQLLQPYSEERVRTSSAGLGTFYKWAVNVIDEVMASQDDDPPPQTEIQVQNPRTKK